MPRVSRQRHGLQGMDRVMARLNRQIAMTRTASMRGLIKAAILIQRDMERTPPLTPVYEGNLRRSWFRDPQFYGKVPMLTIGYHANYAAFVHEMIGASFKRPGAGPKWFQSAIRRNTGNIVKIIQQEARIP